GRTRDHVLDEPHGQLLRQRGDGELLLHAQTRGGLPTNLRDARGGAGGDLRVHRGVLQPTAAALGLGLQDPGGVRGVVELNSSPRPSFVGNVNAFGDKSGAVWPLAGAVSTGTKGRRVEGQGGTVGRRGKANC